MALRVVRHVIYGSRNRRHDACATSFLGGVLPAKRLLRTARSAVPTVPLVPFVPAVLLLLAVALGFASPPTHAGGAAGGNAAGASPQQKSAAKPKVPFPPEVETKFAEFLKKVKEAKGKVWEVRIKKEIDEIAKVTGLNAEGMAALEAASKQPIDAFVDEWIVKLEEIYRTSLPRASAQLLAVFDQIEARIDFYASRDFGIDAVAPTDNPEWIATVRKALTADQAVAWEKVLEERRLAGAKKSDAYLKPLMGGIRESFRRTILAKSAEIARVLALPKERAGALNALAARVAEQSTEDWKNRAAKMVASMPEDQLLQMRLGRASFGRSLNQGPEQQALWKDGLASLLTPDETQRLEIAKGEKRSRRMRALGGIVIVEMDLKVAFNAEQRERLFPIAERLVAAAGFFPEDPPEEYGLNLESQTFLSAGANAPENEMTAILDPSQWKHWKEACDPKNLAASYPRRIVRSPAINSGLDETPPPEPEEFETAFSAFLYEKTAPVRAQLLATMTLKAEDAARLGGLTPESSRRLQVAARGAIEESLASWKTNVDQTVRAQLENTSAPTARQRLAAVQDYVFERVAELKPEKNPVWDKTIAAEMTAEQRAKWQKEVDERNAFRSRSIASLVLSEFDRKNGLSAEQRETLGPIVAGITSEYAPEIGSMFSMGNSNRWYLQNYTMFIPIAGVPVKDLKAILTKEQFDRWKGSDESSNIDNFWTNIQQLHTQRGRRQE